MINIIERLPDEQIRIGQEVDEREKTLLVVKAEDCFKSHVQLDQFIWLNVDKNDIHR